MKDFTTDQIKEYQCIIDNAKDGKYELKILFDSIWKSITPTIFGKQFKENYKKGFFSKITHSTTRTDNHNLYIVDISIKKENCIISQ